MLIEARGRVRDVQFIKKDGDIYYYGVGTAIVVWKLGDEKPRFVDVLDKKNNWLSQASLIELVIPFLRAWKNALHNNVPAPLVIKHSDKHRETTCGKPQDPNRIPGLAAWMRENGKMFVPCKHLSGPKKGQIWYYARRKYKQEGDLGYVKEVWDAVVEFQPYCFKCNFRGECLKPCTNPEVRSEIQLAGAVTLDIIPGLAEAIIGVN